jgi:hypothetical protein
MPLNRETEELLTRYLMVTDIIIFLIQFYNGSRRLL